MRVTGNFFKWIWADKRRAIGALVVLGLLYFGYTKFFKSNSTAVQTQTAQVTKGTIVSSVSASGSILTANLLPVTTSASGVIKLVLVKDGQKVTKGQKIAEIELDATGARENSSAYASYLTAKNNVDSANTQLFTLQSAMFSANSKLINDAVHRNLATDDPTYVQENADWKASESKYNQQAAVISQSQVALNNAWLTYQNSSNIIYAPYSGTIGNITIVPGMSLTSAVNSSSTTSSNGQRVAIVQTEGTPLATFNISEVDVSKVAQGQKATITLTSLGDKTFTGKVISVDKIGTTTSNVTTYPVIIQLDTKADAILPNMATSTNIILDTKNDVLKVPSAAVSTLNGQSTVRVMKAGQEQTISVVTGLSSDTETEIVSGISEGDTVITGTTNTSTSTTSTRSVFSTGFGGGGARIGR
jgi:macrolide-specific efflux system membrane fusion protein